ncbi:rhomboid family intramembrane serine protease [Natrialba swarupiae]|nr:rhomboid family intramembrane serine protease [Natrialba swarupiae]
MFLHLDWSHFRTNMLLWMPFAILLTWMTSNRHVLGLVVGTNVLTSPVLAIGGMAVWGLSGAVFAVVAATLVRATGYAMRGVSRTPSSPHSLGYCFRRRSRFSPSWFWPADKPISPTSDTSSGSHSRV